MKITRSSLKRTFSFSWRDLLVSAAILLCATGACALLHQTADTIDGFASPVYVLAVLLISRFTSGYLFGLIAAVLGVIGVNYVFTYPYMAFNFTISGYPLTMFTFLVVSLVTSTLTTKTKEQDRLRMENEKVKMRADLLRSVSPADAGKTVAQLLGEVEVKTSRTLVLEPGAYPPALVLANFKEKDLDTLLDLMKQAQVNIPLKAVVTPSNKNWVFGDLLAHLSEEHATFTAAAKEQA